MIPRVYGCHPQRSIAFGTTKAIRKLDLRLHSLDVFSDLSEQGVGWSIKCWDLLLACFCLSPFLSVSCVYKRREKNEKRSGHYWHALAIARLDRLGIGSWGTDRIFTAGVYGDLLGVMNRPVKTRERHCLGESDTFIPTSGT